jgi:hypothetical protein
VNDGRSLSWLYPRVNPHLVHTEIGPETIVESGRGNAAGATEQTEGSICMRAREQTPMAGQWLRERAAPRDIVVAYEIGTIADLSGPKTIDLLSLTNPAAQVRLQDDDQPGRCATFRPIWSQTQDR